MRRVLAAAAILAVVGSISYAGLRTGSSRLGRAGSLDRFSAAAAPDPSGATIFVDSVAGNDANSGRSNTTPKQTIAAVRAMSPTASDIIGLKRGGYWREQLYGLPTGAQIVRYGTSGNAPVLDSSDVATGWAATSGRTNVWEKAWARDVTSGSGHSGTDHILLWQDDVQLPGASSIANCESTAGSFFYDEVGEVIYYHPSDNANPSTHTIHITKRPEGIYQYNNAVTVDGVRARRSWAHYGGMSNGVGGTIRNSIIDGCGVHHAVTASGLLEDVIFLETSPRHTATTIPLAFYQPSGAGASAIARRLFVVGNSATKTLQGALLAHTSGSDSWDSITFDQNYSSYGFKSWNVDNGSLTLTNSLAEYGGSAVTLAGNASVSRSIFRDCTGTASGTGAGVIFDYGPADATTRTRTISNSVVYFSGGIVTSVMGVKVTQREGSLTLTNCIIYSESLTDFSSVYTLSNGSGHQLALTINNCIFVVSGGVPQGSIIHTQDANVTYTGDHNIFIQRNPDNAATALPFRWQNNPHATLAAWQTASGQDANSAYLTHYQRGHFWTGTPSDGDFRFNTSAAVSRADGTVFSGTFPDGVALSTAGPQTHWNWSTRAAASGPPQQWPDVPQNMAESETYINSPSTWNFYPAISPSYDADTLTYQTNVVANGGTLTHGQLAAVDAFVVGCKADGIWTKLKDVGVFTGSNLAAARTKLKSFGGGTQFANSGFVEADYSPSTGLTGNGSSKYLSTGFNCNLLTADSTHIAIRQESATLSGGTLHAVGNLTASATSAFSFLLYYSGATTKVYTDQYDTGAQMEAAPGTNAKNGLLVASRNSNSSLVIYRNGSALAMTGTQTSSGTLPASPFYWFALNEAGTANYHMNSAVKFVSLGDGLSAADVTALNTRVVALQTALER